MTPATQSLTTRLNNLSDAHKFTVQLITRLSKLPSVPGALPASPVSEDGPADARVELSSEIHQSLKEQEEELELLKQEVEEINSSGSGTPVSATSAGIAGLAGRRRDSRARTGSNAAASERARLDAHVIRLEEDLKFARTQFRKAQLQAKRNAETARRKERELLFAGVREGTASPGLGRRRGQDKLSPDELMVNASSDVTAALRRTHQLMETELSRSQFAHDTLEQSTNALSSLSESYNTLDTMLASSKNLLSTLVRSQKSDTWYLETAFYVLVGTIVWLIFRRLLYGPLWWFLWLPIKLLYRASVSLLTAVGIGAAGSAATSAAAASRSSSTPSTLIVQPSASGNFPKFHPDQQRDNYVPYIPVGRGGGGHHHGMPAGYHNPPGANGAYPVSAQIGNMVDSSSSSSSIRSVPSGTIGLGVHGTPGGDAAAAAAAAGAGEGSDKDSKDHPQDTKDSSSSNENDQQQPPAAPAPNPKKRMWEENVEAKKYEERKRDEL
ncbi:Sec20-domain-containing protein [Xylona heveae TC161]|uniref:Sec20-domain-containing protein n=1 Tax=Xylona heveae (strain CBS 132557 / TC161) TaxID=1328760 RepID=A0A165JAN6_XYLHT|nr:Sec20-domain-containing protein [Xylona heveae TC161]KZF25979.1 Sec20-domain-containing protein [Xylona heveae TC161]